VALGPLTLEGILIKAPTEAAAFAGGLAIHPALSPLIRDLENITWSAHPDKKLDLVLAAEVAAEDVAQYAAMEDEVRNNGWDSEQFKWAHGATLNAPGVGELLQLLRRNAEVPIDFAHGLRKAKLETLWDDALRNLKDARLSPQQIALGIVRSVVADPGLLAVSLDTSGGVVPAYPVWKGDALAEALTGGYDADRLRVLVGEIGLPMSAQQAASAYFRNIIKLGDYNRAILEGDTRPEWAPFILDQARQIPTAHDGIEGRLRGWLTDAQMYAQTARHGMSKADTDLLFKVQGRPMSHHAVFLAMRRGGVYDGPTTEISAPFLKSLQESNERPEWYNLEWAYRFAQPSVFVIRQWLKDGHDPTWAETKLLYEGWEQSDIDKFVLAYSGGAAAVAADPNVKKAQAKAWTEAQSSYIAQESTAADVQPVFDLLGVDATAAQEIVSTWNAIRALVRKQLTPTQIRKALGEGVINPATGFAWTMADAMAALLARGYDQADATVFLSE
jgi:hypothetical protein